jgi:hypothetical protein
VELCTGISLDMALEDWLFRYGVSVSVRANFRSVPYESSLYTMAYRYVFGIASYCQGKSYPSAAAMPHNLVSRSPLEKGKYICQNGLMVPHCLSTCASVASVCGSQNVMSMAR